MLNARGQLFNIQHSPFNIMNNACIFDVDGVLIDTPHERAWGAALDRLGYGSAGFSTPFYLAHLAGRPRMEGAVAALAALGVPDPDGLRARQYAGLKQAMIVELIASGEFAAFPDALRLLLRLRAAGVRLAAASSSKNADAFMARVPVAPGQTMRDLFDANVCGADLPRGKPDPAIFLAAAAALGLPPAACLVFEDSPAGARAAIAGGMACVGVARLDDAVVLRAAGADPVVTTLDDLRM
ncbi:HAD-IA family hydrolase [Oscillochloris sp. ZM17-4]|uniref:HAD family hydrolase n=1 Tax=Oscillochloris sp. ZM17-4 TaxID=2866714 RepID=UPI001C72D2B9|nr:HAD-IA family hydrolase [Oscillochloris sp. ZM17-4]MBX0327365.1 HAD-IA family hydrolase [Oscillochloris sp. ZM17-4]